MRFLLCLAIAGVVAAQPAGPSIVVGVWYNGPRVTPPAALPAAVPSKTVRTDLVAIKRAGFNGIVTWISWRDGEPRRGLLEVAQLDRLVALAGEEGLFVGIVVYTDDEPAWKKDGTNALAGPFYERVRDRYADRRPAVVVRFAGSVAGTAPFGMGIGAGAPPPTPRQARLAIWRQFIQGDRRLSLRVDGWPLSPEMGGVGELAALLTSNAALFAPLEARRTNNTVRVEPAGGIEPVILESTDAIVIVALNHDDRTHRVKLTFPPDLPEAIWQNMEAGNAVNFVAGPTGPTYEHTFSPHDALVLAIRKRLR